MRKCVRFFYWLTILEDEVVNKMNIISTYGQQIKNCHISTFRQKVVCQKNTPWLILLTQGLITLFFFFHFRIIPKQNKTIYTIKFFLRAPNFTSRAFYIINIKPGCFSFDKRVLLTLLYPDNKFSLLHWHLPLPHTLPRTVRWYIGNSLLHLTLSHILKLMLNVAESVI